MEKTEAPQISIFVTGSVNTQGFATEVLDTAEKLGTVLAKKRMTLLTNEHEGFPLWVQKGSAAEMGTIISFSPAAHRDEHDRVYRLPVHTHITATVYTGFGRVGAEMLAIRSADAIIVGCGEFAYLHALTTAMYEQKPIGILEGEHELHPAVTEVLKHSDYKHDAVFFDADPNRLVERIEAFLRKEEKQV